MPYLPKKGVELEGKGTTSAGASAQQAATKRLKEAYPQKFQEFLAEERTNRGLAANPQIEKITQQITKREQELADLREEQRKMQQQPAA